MNDLQDRLDSAFGSGPPHRPLDSVLTAGRRAVRRRRVAAAGGVLAVVAIVGGTGIALAGGHPSAGRMPVTHAPSVAPSTSMVVPAPEAIEPVPPAWAKDEYARILSDGTVQVRPGAVVHDRVDDYLAGVRRWDVSVALDISYEGDRQWLTVEHEADGGGSSGYTEPNDGWADFRAYVADQAAANGADVTGGDGYPDLVEASGDCSFTPVAPARVLGETTSALPTDFARAAQVAQDGRRYLVLCRVFGGQPELIKIHAEKHGDTLAKLLDYARSTYASGEGVR